MHSSIRIVVMALFCSLLIVTNCGPSRGAPEFQFADHGGNISPSNEYDGPLFELSQDYPESVPEPGDQPWLEVDPIQDPDAYQIAIRDYFLEGMGVAIGRPRALTPEQILMAEAMTADPAISTRQVAEQFGIHRSTLYQHLNARQKRSA